MPGVGPVRCPRPPTAGPARRARTVGRPRPLRARRHRLPRRRDRRLRNGPAPRRRRPPLRAVADDRPRHRLGAGLHHRLRDRRHRPVYLPQETVRLQRAVPPSRTVRRNETDAARSPSTDRRTCVGRSSRPPSTPPGIRPTPPTTPAPKPASDVNAAPKWPASRPPAGSPKRSGTCSPASSPSTPTSPTRRERPSITLASAGSASALAARQPSMN